MPRLLPLLLGTLALILLPSVAMAHDRLVDGAGGALAGVLVAGPIGAVAGGIIGYVSGPDIARGMGLEHHHHYRHYRHHRVYRH